MSRLPGHGAFGLRGRIVGVVLITAVATLAVAALALLGPLEQSLRNAEITTLPSSSHNPGTDAAPQTHSHVSPSSGERAVIAAMVSAGHRSSAHRSGLSTGTSCSRASGSGPPRPDS